MEYEVEAAEWMKPVGSWLDLSWSFLSLSQKQPVVWFCFQNAAATAAKSLQSCPTLCYPVDSNLPDLSVHGILQARILEWVACPPSGNLPAQGLNLHFMSPALADRFFTTSATWGCVRFVLPSVVVHSLSHVQLCDPMDYSTPCSPVLHRLLELA